MPMVSVSDVTALRINVSYLMPLSHDLPGARSVSNSAAILRHEQLQSDVIRSGIMLMVVLHLSKPLHSRLGLATSHEFAQ